MAQLILQNVDFLYEEIISTVTENVPDLEVTTHGIQQLQLLTSVDHAMQAVSEFEEITTSNYVVVEKQKHFGNEEFRPSTKVTVHWEGPVINNICINEYSGVPFIIVGRKVLGCHLGKDKAISQKKRYAESTKHKKTTDQVLVHRRKTFQRTKKMDCPAKIYIYHILKFPGFQIANKTGWQMRSASKKLKGALENNIVLKHNYIILFPQPAQHNHQPAYGEVARKRENIDSRIIEKVTELFKSGVHKKREIKKLVDNFVRCELFWERNLPVNSRRFFPTIKEIERIIRRCTNECKTSVLEQSTVLQLCAQWQQENQDHTLYCRPHSDMEEVKSAENFMLCYQTC